MNLESRFNSERLNHSCHTILAALTLTFAFFVNQAPTLVSYQGSSQAASGSSAAAFRVYSPVQDPHVRVPDGTAGPARTTRRLRHRSMTS